ncbi:MAG TPA: hypothetical protein VEA63_15605, partial [Opitutus sp.]|nr:hypothetical protein [Opitutus sp.]
MNAAHFSRGLGWFSIALGLTELLAPKKLARAIGVGEGHENLLRALGAREIASGLGILARPKPTGMVWSRVAGDAMDLALLGFAYEARGTDRRRLTAAIIAVAGITALDVATAIRLTQPPRADPRWR